MPLRVLALLLVAAAAAAPPPAHAAHSHPEDALPPSSTYMTHEPGGKQVVMVPDTLVDGIVADTVQAESAEACSAACRNATDCRFFTYCGEESGCTDSTGAPVAAHLDCLFLAAECNQTLQAHETGLTGVTSGFPIRHEPLKLSGFMGFAAQGLRNGDLECPESLLPDACVFRSTLAAASQCIRTPECRSIVVFQNGTDGCSGPVALLKTTSLNPANAFISDTAYTLQVSEAQSQEDTFWLRTNEGTVLLPTADEIAAMGGEAGMQDSAARPWRGCVWGVHALMEGEVVQVIDGVASAEACCRLCHAHEKQAAGGALEAGPGGCNVWNYCGNDTASNGACLYEDTDLNAEQVALNVSQCQLRHQELAVPEIGSPPVLLAKAPAVPFTAGAPIAQWAPELPGFTRYVGRSLFSYGRYPCPNSLRPQSSECVLMGDAAQLAGDCEASSECVALLLKPGGIINGTPTLEEVGYLKADADPSKWILNPTTVMFVEQQSSSSGLSTVAIVGIAVGAAAGVALLAAAALFVVWRRRRDAAAQQDLPAPKSMVSGSAAGPEAGTWSTSCGSTEGVGKLPPQYAGVNLQPRGVMLASPFGAQALTAAPSGGVHSLGSSHTTSHASSHGPQPLTAAGAAAARASSGRMPSGGLSAMLPSGGLGGGGGGIVAELMQHVALHDAQSLHTTCQLIASSSEHGQLSADLLPPRLREWLVPREQIDYMKWPNGKFMELGQGASAHVYKAIYNGETVACTEMDLEESAAMQEAFLTEATRLQALRHPNVIGFYGVSLAGSKGIVIMELAEGRDLHSALQVEAAGTHQRLFGWQRRGRRVAFEIAKALNYLHSRGVVHLDVKSQNVLLTANGAVRLADVGFSRIKEQGKTFLSQVPLVGTFAWIAPEVLLGRQQVGSAADIFSFGVVLWEIITGERPQRGSLRMPRVPAECPQEVCDLCLQCLSEEPSERPTAHDLLNTLGAMLERKGARRSVDIGAALRYGGPAGTPHATSDAAGLSGGSAPRSDDAAFASSSAGAASAPPHASV